MTLAPFVLMVLPIATAAYIGEKVWLHRRHWYTIPTGWRLPKVEVAAIASAVGVLFAGAWMEGAVRFAYSGRVRRFIVEDVLALRWCRKCFSLIWRGHRTIHDKWHREREHA